MKIMLMVPPYVDKQSVPGMRFDTKVEDLGLGYIQSFLKSKGYIETCILHCPIDDINMQDLYRIYTDERPDCLGISISFESTDYIGGIYAADVFKEIFPEKIVFAGGHFATFNYERLMNECKSIDYVVLSEGEITVHELVNTIEQEKLPENVPGIAYRSSSKGIIVTPRRKLITDLDMLPFPCRDVYNKRMPEYALIETSRGCWGKCGFCSVPAFFSFCEGPVWRTRSPKSIVDEIEYICERWGITCFDFVDDNFVGVGNAGKEKLEGFADLIRSRGMKIRFNIACRVDSISVENLSMLKEVGLDKVYIGLESGCNITLKRYGKNTTVADNERAVNIVKSLGLNAKLNFIMFDPWMTIDEFRETLQFIEKIDCYDYVHWTSLLNSYKPMTGTIMYERLYQNYAPINESAYFSYPISDKKVERIREACKTVSATMGHIYDIIKKDEKLINSFKYLDNRLSRVLVRLLLYMVNNDNNAICDQYDQVIYNMFHELLKQYMGDDIYEKVKVLI